MNILTVLIIGGIVGWLAARVAGRHEGILASIVIGIVGSVIGSFISTLFTSSNQAYLAFSWMGVFWSFLGALVLVLILNAVQHRTTHHTV
jgi:uncharacterized membrane protein YeaQ/YmgE (transglycosylase-associated protein family)